MIENITKRRLIVVIFFSLLAVCFIVYLTFEKDIQIASSRNYILSSISQGLAAIFALVFTVTLVAIQILSKYSSRATRVFLSKWTIALMFFYAIGIVGPLLAMQQEGELWLDICISWGGFCIFLLVPYFLHLSERLKPKWHIKYLLQRVNSTYIVKENPAYKIAMAPEEYCFNIQDDPLFIILQILVRTVKEGEYDTFVSSLELIKVQYQAVVNQSNAMILEFHFTNMLYRLGKEIINEGQDFLLLRLCYILRDIAILNADRKLPNTKILACIFEYLEAIFLQRQFWNIFPQIINIIREIGLKFAKNKLKNDFKDLASNMRQLSITLSQDTVFKDNSADENVWKIYQFCKLVGILGAEAIKSGGHSKNSIKPLVGCLRSIGTKSAEHRAKLHSGEEVTGLRLSEFCVNRLKLIKKATEERKDDEFSIIIPLIEKSIMEIKKIQKSRCTEKSL